MRLICNRYSILVCKILERDDFGVVEKTHVTSSGCVLHEIYELQWQIQDILDGRWGPIPKEEHQPIILANIFQKLHEHEKKFEAAYSCCPLGSSNKLL